MASNDLETSKVAVITDTNVAPLYAENHVPIETS